MEALARDTGWGPFRLPGERQRLRRAEERAQTLMALVRQASGTSAHETVPATSATESGTAGVGARPRAEHYDQQTRVEQLIDRLTLFVAAREEAGLPVSTPRVVRLATERPGDLSAQHWFEDMEQVRVVETADEGVLVLLPDELFATLPATNVGEPSPQETSAVIWAHVMEAVEKAGRRLRPHYYMDDEGSRRVFYTSRGPEDVEWQEEGEATRSRGFPNS